jgi:hypothetical protein
VQLQLSESQLHTSQETHHCWEDLQLVVHQLLEQLLLLADQHQQVCKVEAKPAPPEYGAYHKLA